MNLMKGIKCYYFESTTFTIRMAATTDAMTKVEILPFFLAFLIHRTFAVNPHIIFILADDLGWNDVGFHGSNQISTPNIDALAYTGIILNNYYVTPICTPSRSALMTGKYPIHTGLQHGVVHGSTPYGLGLNEIIFPQFLKNAGYTTRSVGKWHLGMQHRVIYGGEPWGLDLKEMILPELLKKANYKTSIVGKWHLGHYKKEYLPENRGFDSHYGYWTGHQDYYDHTAVEKYNYRGYDMRRGMKVSWNDRGKYSTDLFTNEAVKVIRNHNSKKPLFLYLAHLATHSANPYDPLQAPPEIVARFSYIKDKKRRYYAAMLAKLDESVGKIVTALAEAKMLNNSVIIFSTDNGGPAAGFDLNAASNWPLRGVKDRLWEGGVRGAAFIWSSLLPSSKVSNSLIHITDWLPTLISLTSVKDLPPNLDGINIWKSLEKEKKSPRKEILLNIDDQRKISAIRYENWKYIKGDIKDWNNWYGPSNRKRSYNWTMIYNSATAKAIKHIKQLPNKKSIKKIRHAAAVNCDSHEEADTTTSNIYLYNLDNDPCEKNNLASKFKEIVQLMDEKLKMYEKTKVPPRNKPIDPRSNPKYWNNTWTNWMDYVE